MQASGDGLGGSVVLQEGVMPTEKSQPERLSSPNVVRVKQVVRQLTYVDQEHYRLTFEYFSVLRERGDFCDVSFTVDKAGRLLHAHKLVLASSSPYFESLFAKGGLSGPIMIDGVDGRTLEQLIFFAYSSEVAINEKNVRKLLRAAQKLRFDGVTEACYRYCKNHIDISNCVQMWKFAEKHRCKELSDAAARCIQLNFVEISKRQEFLELNTEQIVKITMMTELVIGGEEDVYTAVINWARHDPDNRRSTLAQALKNIRFACMDNAFVMNIINTEPLIKDDIGCLEVLCDSLGPDGNESLPNDRLALLSDRPSLQLLEIVEITRSGNPLGLDIMGGTDRPTHIFRQGDKPGLFVIAVVPGGVAEKCGKIRCGDRILAVNGVDITEASHEKAIRTIQSAPDPLLLFVKHETPPPGLKELELMTISGDGFGFSLGGGLGGPSANPTDPSDHGIFITKVCNIIHNCVYQILSTGCII